MSLYGCLQMLDGLVSTHGSLISQLAGDRKCNLGPLILGWILIGGGVCWIQVLVVLASSFTNS